MKILVTGASGFIGAHVICHLLNSGHEVIATSNCTDKAVACSWFEKVDYRACDINNFLSQTSNLFEYFGRPDALIHLAWQGLPNYNEHYHVESNLIPQYMFLKNLISNGLKNITVTGTCLEYGLNNGCLTESQSTNPSNSYAVAKDSLRRFIELLSGSYLFSFKWVRLFYMFGEGQNSKSLIPQLDEAARQKLPVFKMSGGEQLRDFLPIERVAGYLETIATQTMVNGVINCCSGNPISVRKFVEDYILANNLNIQLDLGCYPYPTYEPFAFWGDTAKLKKLSNEF